jgi:hypothetical protein
VRFGAPFLVFEAGRVRREDAGLRRGPAVGLTSFGLRPAAWWFRGCLPLLRRTPESESLGLGLSGGGKDSTHSGSSSLSSWTLKRSSSKQLERGEVGVAFCCCWGAGDAAGVRTCVCMCMHASVREFSGRHRAPRQHAEALRKMHEECMGATHAVLRADPDM